MFIFAYSTCICWFLQSLNSDSVHPLTFIHYVVCHHCSILQPLEFVMECVYDITSIAPILKSQDFFLN